MAHRWASTPTFGSVQLGGLYALPLIVTFLPISAADSLLRPVLPERLARTDGRSRRAP